MSQKIPKAEWAQEKVRIYAPDRIDKITLVAIAGYMNYYSGLAICSKTELARDLGRSPRMVQRHIQSLVSGYRDDGVALAGGQLLLADRGGRYEHRSTRFMIPCCSLSTEELEFIVGISGDQLNLGLIAANEPSSIYVGEHSLKAIVERQWETSFLSMGDSLSDNGRQDVSPPNRITSLKIDASESVNKKGEQGLVKKTKKAIIGQITPDYGADGKVSIAPETEQLISGMLTELAARSR